MNSPIVIRLEHSLESSHPRSTVSRIILFDVCTETGAMSVRDIMEAKNDYLVVRDLLVPMYDFDSQIVLLSRPGRSCVEFTFTSKDRRNRTIQLLNVLEPH